MTVCKQPYPWAIMEATENIHSWAQVGKCDPPQWDNPELSSSSTRAQDNVKSIYSETPQTNRALETTNIWLISETELDQEPRMPILWSVRHNTPKEMQTPLNYGFLIRKTGNVPTCSAKLFEDWSTVNWCKLEKDHGNYVHHSMARNRAIAPKGIRAKQQKVLERSHPFYFVSMPSAFQTRI